MFLAILAFSGHVLSSPAFPLKVSDNGHYLADLMSARVSWISLQHLSLEPKFKVHSSFAFVWNS
jgi:hypothetical protein